MSFFEKNSEVIAVRQPDLAGRLRATTPSFQAVVSSSRKGYPSLMVGQNRLTSSVDPLDEGLKLSRQMAEGPVVALGFGLGYHLQPLANASRELLVWEPDLQLLRLSLAVRDCSDWLTNCTIVSESSELPDIKGRQAFIPRAMQRLYPLQAVTLERLVTRGEDKRAPRPDQPRVLVLPPLMGGTLDIAYWCGEALLSLGCQVRVVPIDQAAPLYRRIRASRLPLSRQGKAQAPLVRCLGELAVLEAEEFAPDLVLALAQAPTDRRTVNDLKALGASTAFWFVEDHRQMTYFSEIASTYDYFFHIQDKDFAGKLERLGVNHHFLPVAAHPPCHRPLGLSLEEMERKGADIGFMGAGYPNRVAILTQLLNQDLPLKIWGSDWPSSGPISKVLQENRYISSQEIVDIYNSCQIVLNLHSSRHADTPVGGTDFINPRTFEVSACGAFQLVDKVPGLEEFFSDEEMATYSSEEELLEKAAYYLERPSLRQTMANAARHKVLHNHTYYHRMENLLDICLGPISSKEAAPDPLNWLLSQDGLI